MNRLSNNRAVSWVRARWRTIGIAAAGLIVLFGVVGYFAIPAAARWGIETVASRELGRAVSVEKISANPFTLRVTLNDVTIAGQSGEPPLLKVKQAAVNASAQSLFRLAPVIDAFAIEGLAANIIRYEPQRFNFSDIIDRLRSKPKTDDEPARFAVYNIKVAESRVDLDDRVLAKRHALTDIALGIPFLSSLETHNDVEVEPLFAARIDGAPLELHGETLPFDESLESSITLKLDALDIPRYLAYSPVRLNFAVGRGKLDTNLRIAFQRAAPAREDRPARPERLVVSGSFGIDDFQLSAPAGAGAKPLLGWKGLHVVIDDAEVLKRRVVVGEIVLAAPDIVLERDSDGAVNWQRFAQKPLAEEATSQSPPAAPRDPLALTLQRVTVRDGRIDFTDASVGQFRQEIVNLNAEASGLTTTSPTRGKVRVSALIRDNAGVGLVGEVGLAPVAGRLNFAARESKLKLTARYLARAIEADMDGDSDVDAVFEFGPGDSGIRLALRDIRVSGKEIKIRGPAGSGAALEIAALGLEGGEIDLTGRSVTIGKLALDAPRIVVKRLSDGELNWMRVTRAKGAPTPASEPSDSPTTAPPWKFRLKQAEIARGDAQFEDLATEPAVKLRASAITGTFSNVVGDGSEQAEFELRTRFGSGGTLAARGDARWDALAVNARLDARNLDIAALRPYFAARLNAVLAKAELTSRSSVGLRQPNRQAPVSLAFRGDARIGNLHALDAIGENDLLKWQLLDIDRIAVKTGTGPPTVELGKVTLSDFFARVIVSEQGRLNLADLVKKEADPGLAAQVAEVAAVEPTSRANSTLPVDRETTPAAPEPATTSATTATLSPPAGAATRPTIRIAQVELVRGNVNFTDNFIKPNYTANMTGLGGTLSTLASDQDEPATLALAGRIDDEAPVEINGRLNPLAPKLFLDIEAHTKGVDLPRMTPYSVKYAGYPIVKGKLSMDVKYKVEDQKLAASNHLFLDQLTFGDKVESPTATKLPVLLAVSLLKNTRGEIDINLPISGSLNDPKFSMGGIIVQVIVNLLTKIVTAPFALLAAAFGGGEELGYIEFAPGASVLAAEQQKRLETLAKALNDRPALRLDIIGRVDPAADTDGVKRAKYDAKLRAAKVRQVVRAGGDSIDPAKITISDAEKPALIAAVYSDEPIPNKPRNVIGFAKSIPAPEMEQLILANLSVAPEDLRALANQRASVVRNHLENEGKVGRERLFLVEPKLSGEGIKDKGAKTRVDFSLK
jgi:uncharacterized protein involved in outer membrane biogenesis